MDKDLPFTHVEGFGMILREMSMQIKYLAGEGVPKTQVARQLGVSRVRDFSRMLFVRFTTSSKLPVLLFCLQEGLSTLGIPKEVLVDNMRQAVDQHDVTTGTVRWNSAFLDFAEHWVRRTCPNTRHARRSETASVSRTCTTASRRRVGLRSFPGRPLSESRCPTPGLPPNVSGVRSPAPVP